MTPEAIALLIQGVFSLATNVMPEVIKLFGNKLSEDDLATLESFQSLVTRIDFDKEMKQMMDAGDDRILQAFIDREEKT